MTDDKIEISPADIRHKEFKSSIFGYNKDEIREYLEMLAEQFEDLYAQRLLNNSEAVAVNVYEDRAQTQLALEQIQKREELISKTLIQAENTRTDIIRGAQREAETIIKEAELSAKKAIYDTNNFINNLKHDFINTKENHRQYLMAGHSQIRVILERLEQDVLFTKEREAELNAQFDEVSRIKWSPRGSSDVQ